MNTYILTGGWNFKIFLKENDAVALDWTVVTYLLVEHVIEHDLDSAYGVCIH